jgi:hypothetical protein
MKEYIKITTLWAHRLSEKNARWDTKYVEELPPRY